MNTSQYGPGTGFLFLCPREHQSRNDDNIEVPVSCEVSFERGELVSAGAVIARQHNKAIPIETFRIVMNNIGITIPDQKFLAGGTGATEVIGPRRNENLPLHGQRRVGLPGLREGQRGEEAANAIREAVTKVIGNEHPEPL